MCQAGAAKKRRPTKGRRQHPTRTHPAPFRARLTHTSNHALCTVSAHRHNGNKLARSRREEQQEAGFYQTKREKGKDTTANPDVSPFVHVIWQNTASCQRCPSPSNLATNKKTEQRSRSKPFYGAQHTPHPTQEEGLSTQLNIYTKLCTMWKEAPSRAIREGQKRKKKKMRKTWQP